jgi:glutathione-regulated potassium-efflux system protein KefB
MDLGIDQIRRETFLASLELTRDLLRGLGHSEVDIKRTTEGFTAIDRKRLYEGYRHSSDLEKLQAQARQYAEELEQLFDEDVKEEAKAAGEAPVTSPKEPA